MNLEKEYFEKGLEKVVEDYYNDFAILLERLEINSYMISSKDKVDIESADSIYEEDVIALKWLLNTYDYLRKNNND